MPAPTCRLIKPTAKPIAAYDAALQAFKDQDISHEPPVRSAFQTPLADLARPHKWTLIPELGSKVRGKGRIIPDATLRDEFHLHHGHWETKDTADDRNPKSRAAFGFFKTTNQRSA